MSAETSLVGSLVMASVRAANYTTDQLIESERQISVSLAETVLELREAIQASAAVVSTPVLDRALLLSEAAASHARYVLDRGRVSR